MRLFSLDLTFVNYISVLPLYLFLNFYLFILLHWVFVATLGLSLVAVSGGYSSFQCTASLVEHRLEAHVL